VSGPAGTGRPRLAAVPPPSESAAPAPPAPPEASPNGVQARWVWLLAAALLLALIGLGMESRRAGRLAADLAVTQARAESAEARVRAYDGYLAAVRERATELQRTVAGLAGVLDRDPADGAPRE
jgi:uncharacterized protein HemX